MNPDLEKIALRLHELFVVGGHIYLQQRKDGRYSAMRRRLSAARIQRMLESGESLATFQFVNGVTRWICLDFDLARGQEATDGSSALLADVWSATRKCSRTLKGLSIDHLVEFSGRRGFHIWVLLDGKVPRAVAHQLLDAILTRTGLAGDLGPVKIDRFPSGPQGNGSRGRAVKLPLSKHVVSGGYAYLIRDVEQFHVETSLPRVSLDTGFIAAQCEVLNGVVLVHPADALAVLGYRLAAGTVPRAALHYLQVEIRVANTLEPSLDNVLRCLCRCNCVKGVMDNITAGEKPDEATRLALVGLLVRLKSDIRPRLGMELLHQLFGRFPGYDRARTEHKIGSLAHLFPPTCEQLNQKLPEHNCECSSFGEWPPSPIQYLAELGVEFKKVDPFELHPSARNSLRTAQLRYTHENDEVPLYWTTRELAGLSDTELSELCQPVVLQRRRQPEYYTFERPEEGGGVRRLFALSARDKVWTTACILILEQFIRPGRSENSFGYQIEPYLVGQRLFRPWLTQWRQFTSSIGELVYDPDYDEWGLLKLDVKSFYESIDLARLRVKLYDGPTPALRERFRALPEDIRDGCRQLADQLIGLCRAFGDGRRGVPQGPAFARFLAEVYLMDFDALVESHPLVAPGNFARYVDDIFLIVPPSADLAELEAQLLHYLATLGLSHNPSKHFRGRVREYRGAFRKYWQESKYSIDRVGRRYASAPAEEIQRAARDMYALVSSGERGEINTEHLNFFYTHLGRDPAVSSLQRDLERSLLQLKEGRGSLFNNFFRFYVGELRLRGFEYDPAILQIDGLKKECFLNVLLLELAEAPPADATAWARLRDLLSTLLKVPDTYLVEDLGLALQLNQNALATILGATPSRILRMASHDFPKSVSDEAGEILQRELLELELPELTDALFELTFSETRLSPKLLGSLLNDFRNKAMEAIRQADSKGEPLGFLNPLVRQDVGELRDRYYQLCCLASLSDPAPQKPSEVLDVLWGNFVRASNRLDSPISRPRWIERIDAVALDDRLLNIVLTKGLGDVVPGVRDDYGVFKSFHELLVLDLISTTDDDDGPQVSRPTDLARSKVREAVEQNPTRWRFLQWVLDGSANTHYSPNRDECLANIAANDITVLRRGTQVLVRLPKLLRPGRNFQYLDGLSVEPDALQGGRYVCECFHAPGSGYVIVSHLFNKSDGLLGYIDAVLDIRAASRNFANTYRPASSYGVPNPLASLAMVTDDADRKPDLPHLLLGRQLIVARAGGGFDHLENSSERLDEALLRKLQDSDRRLLEDSRHPANLHASELDNKLLAAFSTTADKIDFLDALRNESRLMRLSSLADPFELELCKARALLQLVKADTEKKANWSQSQEFFDKYLRLRDDREFEYRLLLSPECECDVKLDTLHDVYRTVERSLVAFLESLDPKHRQLGIQDLLEADLRRLHAAACRIEPQEGVPPTANAYRRCIISRDADRGGLMLDGQEVSLGDSGHAAQPRHRVLELGLKEGEFEYLGPRHILKLESTAKRVYIAQWANRLLFVIAPDAIFQAAEWVGRRKSEYNRLVGALPPDRRRLACYVSPWRERDELRRLPRYHEAVRVVKENHPDFNDELARQHFESWMLYMPREHRQMLTTVVAAHEPMTADDEKQFLQRLQQFVDGERVVVFSLTTWDDLGGWQRLVARDAELGRRLRVTDVQARLRSAAERGGGHDVVIVVDLVASGTQIINALKLHYCAASDHRNADGRHYFRMDDRDGFARGLRTCKSLKIVCALHTAEGAQKLKDELPTLEVWADQAPSIHVVGREIGVGEYQLGGTRLESAIAAQFKQVISNMEFVQTLFALETSSQQDYYRQSIAAKHIDSTNLITRRGSVPKGSARMFRLALHDGHQGLFAYVPEHDDLDER